MDLRLIDSLESTNKYCELLDLSVVEEFTVVCAREQRAGVGQRGSHWHSEPGKNLTFSLVLKPRFVKTARQYMLTKVVSLGVVDALETVLVGIPGIMIKWPNDIYVGTRKICGILISNRVSGDRLSASIVGIGLNVNEMEFPDWVPNPVSVMQLIGMSLPLEPLLKRVVDCVGKRYDQLRASLEEGDTGDMDREYLSRLLFMGEERRYVHNGETITATITGVNCFGHLELTTPDGGELVCGLKELVFKGITD